MKGILVPPALCGEAGGGFTRTAWCLATSSAPSQWVSFHSLPFWSVTSLQGKKDPSWVLKWEHAAVLAPKPLCFHLKAVENRGWGSSST